MTYIVCVCNACGKTFIFVLFTIAPLKAYVKCPHCESVDVQEIDIKSGSWENEEKKVENPRLPLMIQERDLSKWSEGPLTGPIITQMIDDHKKKYDSLPSYIKFSEEFFDRFGGLLISDLRYTESILDRLGGGKQISRSNYYFNYRNEKIEVRVSE